MALLAIIKESAGFIGTIAIAIPWLRDFGARVRRDRTASIPVRGKLQPLKVKLLDQDERWLAAAKVSDLGWTIVGLALIASSFAVGIVQAIGETPSTTECLNVCGSTNSSGSSG